MIKSLCIFLLSISLCSAQTKINWKPKEQNPLNFPTDDKGEIQYREVVSFSKATPAKMLRRARSWVASTYPSANDMVQEFDTTSGQMIVKGNLKLKPSGILGHKLVVEAKEGRYRITVNELALLYELTNPVRLSQQIPMHTYGCDADDIYNMFLLTVASTTAAAGVPMNYKRHAARVADNQTAMLTEVKKTMESLMGSLKKAIEGENDW